MADGIFLTGPIMGHVVRMTATGAMGISFVFLVDAANLFWISQLGDAQLVAAVGFAYSIQFFAVAIGVGFMIAATALVSRRIGEGRRDEARRQAGAAIVTAMSVQALFALAIIAFRAPLVGLAGAEDDTALLAERYLAMTMLSLVPMAGGLIGSGALRAEGYGAKAMYITFFSALFLMVLDPILILWLGLGLDGAAYGVFLFRILLLVLAWYFAIHMHGLVAWPDIREVLARFWPYMATAVPIIGTQIATPVGNYILTVVISDYGDDAVAAWSIVGRLTVLVFGGVFALSAAIGGIFGQNFGAGQFDRVKATYRDALMFVLLYTLVMWGALVLATPALQQAFALTDTGAEVLRAFTHVGVGGFMFIGTLFVANAAFNALGKPVRATVMNWLVHVVVTGPLGFGMAIVFGAVGVIYGQALASALAGGLAAYLGWRYVASLGPDSPVKLGPERPWPSIDRYRRF